jgi:hypothetical protein
VMTFIFCACPTIQPSWVTATALVEEEPISIPIKIAGSINLFSKVVVPH